MIFRSLYCDCVSHSILLTKIGVCDVEDDALRKFESYLVCRQQVVEWNGVTSKLIEVGVLEPLQFIVSINDWLIALFSACIVKAYGDSSSRQRLLFSVVFISQK